MSTQRLTEGIVVHSTCNTSHRSVSVHYFITKCDPLASHVKVELKHFNICFSTLSKESWHRVNFPFSFQLKVNYLAYLEIFDKAY